MTILEVFLKILKGETLLPSFLFPFLYQRYLTKRFLDTSCQIRPQVVAC